MNPKHQIVLTVLAAYGLSLSAAPVFTSNSSACNNPDSESNSTLAQTFVTNPNCHNGTTAEGFAGPLGIGGRASGLSENTIFTGNDARHLGKVEFSATFRGPGGAPGTTDVALNFFLTNLATDPVVGQGGLVSMTLFVGAPSAFGMSFVSSVSGANSNGLTAPGLNVTNQLITSRAFTVPLNTPVGFVYQMEVVAGVAGFSGMNESMLLDALQGFTFAKLGPVFSLAPGISVDDIPELYLRNNQFTPPSSTVPEPNTAALFGLGVAAWIGRSAWRRRIF